MNADLANDLGNLAQRSLSMIAKNCGGLVPQPGAFTAADLDLMAEAEGLLALSRSAMAQFALHEWLTQVWRVVGSANRYFASEEPWIKRKSDPARMATILYVTAEVLRTVVILVQPVMPGSAAKLLDLLGVAPEERDFVCCGQGRPLVPGRPLPAPSVVFPRFLEPEPVDAEP